MEKLDIKYKLHIFCFEFIIRSSSSSDRTSYHDILSLFYRQHHPNEIKKQLRCH